MKWLCAAPAKTPKNAPARMVATKVMEDLQEMMPHARVTPERAASMRMPSAWMVVSTLGARAAPKVPVDMRAPTARAMMPTAKVTPKGPATALGMVW